MADPNAPTPKPDRVAVSKAFAELAETVHRLRAPGGCAWDRAQTHQSLRPYVIEEAYEVLDCLDRVENSESLKDPVVSGSLKEELGDLLMQVMLHSEMTNETGAFSVVDVADGLREKLIRRHPHVFGDVSANTEQTAFQTWEKQKAKEKELRAITTGEDPSVLEGLPKGLPALARTARVIEKVTKVGFQWPDLAGPIAKLDEELSELKAELTRPERDPKAVAGELGDLLFSLANVAYLTGVNPEDALRGTLQKFERRFRFVERSLRRTGKRPEDSSLAEMDALWDQAKRQESEDTHGHQDRKA